MFGGESGAGELARQVGDGVRSGRANICERDKFRSGKSRKLRDADVKRKQSDAAIGHRVACSGKRLEHGVALGKFWKEFREMSQQFTGRILPHLH